MSEMIGRSHGEDRRKIEDMLRRIDQANGDINHYLRHLAEALARQYDWAGDFDEGHRHSVGDECSMQQLREARMRFEFRLHDAQAAFEVIDRLQGGHSEKEIPFVMHEHIHDCGPRINNVLWGCLLHALARFHNRSCETSAEPCERRHVARKGLGQALRLLYAFSKTFKDLYMMLHLPSITRGDLAVTHVVGSNMRLAGPSPGKGRTHSGDACSGLKHAP